MARFCASLTAMAVLAGMVVPAVAQDKADGAAFQTVITKQLDAIAHDDATTAQSFASPGIQQKFPDPTGFLNMVKQSYAPLVKPRSTHFDTAGDTGLGPMERVTIIDSAGVVWTAVYTFEQVNGQWRITGCSLLKAPDTTA